MAKQGDCTVTGVPSSVPIVSGGWSLLRVCPPLACLSVESSEGVPPECPVTWTYTDCISVWGTSNDLSLTDWMSSKLYYRQSASSRQQLWISVTKHLGCSEPVLAPAIPWLALSRHARPGPLGWCPCVLCHRQSTPGCQASSWYSHHPSATPAMPRPSLAQSWAVWPWPGFPSPTQPVPAGAPAPSLPAEWGSSAVWPWMGLTRSHPHPRPHNRPPPHLMSVWRREVAPQLSGDIGAAQRGSPPWSGLELVADAVGRGPGTIPTCGGRLLCLRRAVRRRCCGEHGRENACENVRSGGGSCRDHDGGPVVAVSQ